VPLRVYGGAFCSGEENSPAAIALTQFCVYIKGTKIVCLIYPSCRRGVYFYVPQGSLTGNQACEQRRVSCYTKPKG
jgi:hypothetical protein